MQRLIADLNELHDADLNQVIALAGANDYVTRNGPKRQKAAELLAWAGRRADRLARIREALLSVKREDGEPDEFEPLPSPLSLPDMIARGLLTALVVRYADPTSAKLLLLSVRFPEHLLPSFDSVSAFWLSVCQKIEKGTPPGNLEVLLARAASDYPGSPELAPYRGR